MSWNIIIFLVLNMAFVSAALHIATLVFLFFARVRFRASDSLTGVLRKRYGRDVVNEVRNLEKKDLKHKKTILDLDLLIYNRQNCVFLKSLQFKVSNKPLRTSKAYIFYQKRLFNQEVNNKQKASKILQE